MPQERHDRNKQAARECRKKGHDRNKQAAREDE
jgi:hypothetical protein